MKTAIDPERPVIVTATRIGPDTSIYILSRDSRGFTVEEYGDSGRDGEFSWIAIGTRRTDGGEIAPEVLSSEFDDKIERGLGSEIRESGTGIYYSGGELIESKPPARKVEQKVGKKSEKTGIIEKKNDGTTEPSVPVSATK